MKLLIKKLSLLGLLGLLSLSLVACVTTTTTTTTTTATTTTTTTTVSVQTDAEKVAAALAGIDLGTLTAVTANITLPASANGVSFSWASSNANVLSNSGAITVPAYLVGDVTATLTVTATLNAASDTRAFEVTVLKESAAAFLARAGLSIIIDHSDSITSNFNLPATALGATVTWVSSNTDIAVIAATAVDGFYAVTVTRPQVDDGGVNTSVTLTATISIDSTNITVVKSVRVIAEAGSVHVTTIAEGLAEVLGTYITWEGMTILGKGTDGFYFTDGIDIMFVYNASVTALIEEGEVYDITGGIALYNSIPEVQNIGTNVVKVKASTEAVRNVAPVVATIAEIIANHEGYTGENPMVFGYYTVTAKVFYYNNPVGANYCTYLVPTDATVLDKGEAIRIYYKGDIEVVKALYGQNVTLDVIMFGYNTSSTYLDWYGYFFGTADDIQVAFESDQEAIDAALGSLMIPASIIEGTTLDLPSSLYGVTLTYSSDNETLVNSTTGVVDLTGLTGQETVVLTVTGTKGTTTDTKTFSIKVGETPLSTIAEVLAMNTSQGIIAKVEGTVYALYQMGYFIFDETGLFQVYTVPTGLSLGDKVVVMGTVAAYKGEVQFTFATVEETVSTGNPYAQVSELYIPGVTQLVAGQTYTTIATVFWGPATVGGYNNLYLKDAAGNFLFQIYYKALQVPYDALKAMAGQTVSLDVIYYNNKTASNPADISFIYSGGAVAATEAAKVAADKEALMIDLAAVAGGAEMLPITGVFGSVVTWDVSLVTGAVYEPLTGALTYPNVTVDTDFVLTATITNGTSSDTKAFTVSVRAVTDAEKLVEAQTALTIALLAKEYDTVALPTTGLNGVTVAWALNTGDAVLTESSLFFNLTGTAYDVTLTATLSLGTETDLTKDFTVAVSPITIISDLSTLTAKSGEPLAWTIPNTTPVYVKGVVTGLVYDGVFIQDTSGNGLLLYRLSKTGLAVGDEIVAYGTMADYRSARQLGNGGVLKTILSSGNTVSSQALTLDEVIALTYADCGAVFTVTGLEVYSYTSSTAIFKVIGTSSVQYLRLYFQDWAPWLDDVYPVGSTLPEVQFNMYNIYTTNIANPGDTFNIDNFLIEVTDEQLLDVALAALAIPTSIPTAMTLTLPATVTGVALTYASSNEAVINSTTGVVDLTGITGQITVTLTVTATYGEGTKDLVISIKVGIIPLSTVAEARVAAASTIVRVHGVVTMSEYYRTYTIQDSSGGVALYTSNATILAFLAANYGKEVEIIGSMTAYSGLIQIAPTDATLVGDGVLPTPVDLDAVTLDATNLLPYQGQLVALTNMLVSDVYVDSYGNTTLTLVRVSDGTSVKMKWDSRTVLSTEANAALVAVVEGDVLNVQSVLGWASNNPLLFYNDKTVLSAGTLTDQAIADYELTTIVLPSTPQTADFLLDVLGALGSTVTWSSNDAAIAVVGADATVTRPASGQADAVVTLTYSLTFGTATVQATIDITVTAESSEPVETVAYSTGFEAPDFAVTTVYNSMTPALFGPSGYQWSFTMGTTSTTGPIDDLQSAQCRWYTSTPANIGTITTAFTVADVTKVVFDAATYSTTTASWLNVEVSYSFNGTDWLGAEVFTLTNVKTSFTYDLNVTGNVYIRYTVVVPVTTNANGRFLIDNVQIFNMQ